MYSACYLVQIAAQLFWSPLGCPKSSEIFYTAHSSFRTHFCATNLFIYTLLVSGFFSALPTILAALLQRFDQYLSVATLDDGKLLFVDPPYVCSLYFY
jgi:hypothetical protein